MHLQRDVPCKVDIGAIFDQTPLNPTPGVPTPGGTTLGVPISKEFVIDIDMTDYDRIRTCCQGANICSHCWYFIVGAVRVLDQSLRVDFGFQHILWVYSGRRGIHGWVCDGRARTMSNEVREALVHYLTLDEKKDFVAPLHPAITRAYHILLPIFEVTCLSQKFFSTDAQCQKVLDMIPPKLREQLWNMVGSDSMDSMDSISRWRQLQANVKTLKINPQNRDHLVVATLLPRIVLSHCYPKLDVNVSKQMQHLLKSPFSIHPTTKRICIPIDLQDMEAFHPWSVPTLYDVTKNFSKGSSEGSSESSSEELSKSKSFWKAVDLFALFVKKLNLTTEQ
jgi:DNA primase small subunit